MKNLLFLSAAVLFLFSNCTKETYGNTDIYSDTYTADWTFDDPSYRVTISEAKITQDVIDNGAVMVYISNGSGGWIALPCTLPQTASYASTYSYVLHSGGVTVWKTDTDLLTLDPGAYGVFKIVVLSQHGLKQHPDLNLTDYEEVKKELNL